VWPFGLLGNGGVESSCGVQMAELERILAQQGYAVSSWRAMDQTVRAEGIAPLQAAGRLGADMMIQVHSFELTTLQPLEDLNWETRFYESDKGHSRGLVVMGCASIVTRRASSRCRGSRS